MHHWVASVSSWLTWPACHSEAVGDPWSSRPSWKIFAGRTYGVPGGWRGSVKFLEVADHPALADAYPALSVCAAAVSGGEVSVGCQASTTLGVLLTACSQTVRIQSDVPAHVCGRRCRSGAQRWTDLCVMGRAGGVQIPGALPAPDSGSEHRINSIISVPCAAIR
jgi:hypothetical protein